LAHPTIKQDQPFAADMLDGIHKPQPLFDKPHLVSSMSPTLPLILRASFLLYSLGCIVAKPDIWFLRGLFQVPVTVRKRFEEI